MKKQITKKTLINAIEKRCSDTKSKSADFIIMPKQLYSSGHILSDFYVSLQDNINIYIKNISKISTIKTGPTRMCNTFICFENFRKELIQDEYKYLLNLVENSYKLKYKKEKKERIKNGSSFILSYVNN